jgi:hypothetical protein
MTQIPEETPDSLVDTGRDPAAGRAAVEDFGRPDGDERVVEDDLESDAGAAHEP